MIQTLKINLLFSFFSYLYNKTILTNLFQCVKIRLCPTIHGTRPVSNVSYFPKPSHWSAASVVSPGSEIDYLVAPLVQFVEELDHADVVRRDPNSGKNVAGHLPNGVGNL